MCLDPTTLYKWKRKHAQFAQILHPRFSGGNLGNNQIMNTLQCVRVDASKSNIKDHTTQNRVANSGSPQVILIIVGTDIEKWRVLVSSGMCPPILINKQCVSLSAGAFCNTSLQQKVGNTLCPYHHTTETGGNN